MFHHQKSRTKIKTQVKIFSTVWQVLDYDRKGKFQLQTYLSPQMSPQRIKICAYFKQWVCYKALKVELLEAGRSGVQVGRYDTHTKDKLITGRQLLAHVAQHMHHSNKQFVKSSRTWSLCSKQSTFKLKKGKLVLKQVDTLSLLVQSWPNKQGTTFPSNAAIESEKT